MSEAITVAVMLLAFLSGFVCGQWGMLFALRGGLRRKRLRLVREDGTER